MYAEPIYSGAKSAAPEQKDTNLQLHPVQSTKREPRKTLETGLLHRGLQDGMRGA
jgi:hypothetical protein